MIYRRDKKHIWLMSSKQIYAHLSLVEICCEESVLLSVGTRVWLLWILSLRRSSVTCLPLVKVNITANMWVFCFMSVQSTSSVQIRIMCSHPWCMACVLYKHGDMLLREFELWKCCNTCDVKISPPFLETLQKSITIQDPPSTQPSSIVLSTLLILSPPGSPVLSSIPSLCSSSPLWPLVVWDVWGLGPALLT